MPTTYDNATIAYDSASATYDSVAIAATDPFVLFRLTTSSPKRLALVRSAIGARAGFSPSEGWEIVSKRFALPVGTRDVAMAAVRTVWLANRDAATATLKTALDAELATNAYTFPGDGAAPATDS